MMWLVAVGTDALVLEFRAPMSAGAHPRFREAPPLCLPLAIYRSIGSGVFGEPWATSATLRTAFSPTRQDSQR